MARRYIGDAVIRISYHDDGDYRGTVSAGGYVWRFDGLHAAPIGFGPGVAYDSSAAYDKMAEAAVVFGSNPEEGEGRDPVSTAIGDATGFAMDDSGKYEVRRKP